MTLADLIVDLKLNADQFMGGVESALGKWNSVSGSMLAGGAALTAGITVPIIGLGSAALSLASQMLGAEMGFTTMLGSAEKAQKLLNELKEFAAKTPFEFTDLVLSAKRMMALGFEAEQVIPTLRSIGDAVAGMSGGPDMIERIVQALGRMNTKGKVSAEQMNMLTDAGISGWKILAQKMGVSIAEVQKLSEQGMITAVEAVPLLIEGMGEKFKGLMDRFSQTAIGRFSNLKDAMGFILVDIGKAIMPLFNTLLEKVLIPAGEALKGLVAQFAQLPEWIKSTVIIVAVLASAVGPLLVVLGGMSFSLTAIIGLVNIMGGAGAILGAALGPVAIVVAAVAAAFALWQLEPVRDAVKGLWEAIQPLLAILWDLAKALVGGIWDALKTVYEQGLKPLWEQGIEPLIMKLRDLWSSLEPVRVALAALWNEAIRPAIEWFVKLQLTIAGVFMQSLVWLVDTILNGVMKAFQALTSVLDGSASTFGALKDVVNAVGSVFDAFKEVGRVLWQVLVDLWNGAIKPLWAALGELWKAVEPVVEWFGKLVLGIAAVAGWLIEKGLILVLEALALQLQAIGWVISSIVVPAITWVINLFKDLWETCKVGAEYYAKIFGPVWIHLKDTFNALVAEISKAIAVFRADLGPTLDWIGQKTESTRKLFANLIEGLKLLKPPDPGPLRDMATQLERGAVAGARFTDAQVAAMGASAGLGRATTTANAEHKKTPAVLGAAEDSYNDLVKAYHEYLNWLAKEHAALLQWSLDMMNAKAKAADYNQYILTGIIPTGRAWTKQLQDLNTSWQVVQAAMSRARTDAPAVAANLKSLFDTFLPPKIDIPAVSADLQTFFNAFTPGLAATNAVSSAMTQLKITTTSSLQEAARQATESYNTMRSSGVSTAYELQQAAVNSLEAQKKARLALGEVWTEADQSQLKSAKDMLATMTGDTQVATGVWAGLWEGVGKQISTIFTDLSKGITDVIWSGKNLGETFLGIFEEMGKAVTRFVLEYLEKLLFQKLLSLVTDIVPSIAAAFASTAVSVGKNLLDIGKSIADVSTSAVQAGKDVLDIGKSLSSVAATATTAAPTAGGAVGAATSAAGGLLTTITSLANLGVNIAAGIVAGFQAAKTNDWLQKIEESTRYTMLYIGGREDQGVLGALFNIVELLAWGPMTKAAEALRDIISGAGLIYLNPSLDTMKEHLGAIRFDLLPRAISALEMIAMGPETSLAAAAAAGPGSLEITVNALGTSQEVAEDIAGRVAELLLAQGVVPA